MDSRTPIFRLSRARRSFLLWLTIVVPLAAASFLYKAPLTARAVVEEAVADQLIANSTVGRQALVGSCWWPPLPVLLKVPLQAYLGPVLPHAASRLLPVFALAALWLLLNSRLRGYGIGRFRWVLATLPLCTPHLVSASLSGSNAPLAILFTVVAAAAQLQWTNTRQLRHLGVYGFAIAALAGCGPDMVPWLVASIVVFSLLEPLGAASRGEARATILLALLPVVYAWLVWVLMSWLIMGNPLYFMRSLFEPYLWQANWALLADGFTLSDWLTFVLSAATVAALTLRRDWSAALLVLLAAALLPLGRALQLLGMGDIDPIPVLAILPLMVLILPRLARHRPRRAIALPTALLLLFAAADARQFTLQGRSLDRRDDAIDAVAVQRELEQVAAFVQERTHFGKVFVPGHEGLALLSHTSDPLFVAAMDFNFNDARNSYYGQSLYILVRAPEGLAATDSLHWLYPDIYAYGSRSTLYAGDWGPWRLFEIIQAPIRK